MTRPRSLRGIALIEVLLGVFILGTGAFAATMLAIVLLRTSAQTKDEVAAVNLAREALEAVRNVRDTNWQINSGSQRDALDPAREHWNDGFKDALLDATVGATYVPVLDRSACVAAGVANGLPCSLERWLLVKVAGGGTGTSDVDVGDASTDYGCTTLAGLMTNRTQLYERIPNTHDLHELPELLHPCAEAVGGLTPELQPSRFARTVTVRYLEPSTHEVAAVDSATAKEVWVEAVVTWYSGTDATTWPAQTPREVRLATTLTDWFGRKDKPVAP